MAPTMLTKRSMDMGRKVIKAKIHEKKPYGTLSGNLHHLGMLLLAESNLVGILERNPRYVRRSKPRATSLSWRDISPLRRARMPLAANLTLFGI